MKLITGIGKYSKLGIGKIFITMLLAGCGGGGGGGGSSGLATGIFTKTVEVATATGIHYTEPFSDVDSEIRFMFLLTAADIKGNGNVGSVRFKYFSTQAISISCPNTTIKMGATTVTTLSTTFDSNQNQGSFKTVLNDAVVSIPAGSAGSYFNIDLTTPFEYNGKDNLVVEITRTSACTASQGVITVPSAFNGVVKAIGAGASTTATGTAQAYSMHMELVFAGGSNIVTAADGTGNNGNTIAPTSTGRSQFLILASDINGSGPITGIQIRPASTLAAINTATYKVTLSHVPSATTTLTSTTFATNVGTNATVVADGVSVSLPIGTTEWWLPLNGSFSYDGTSNLLIDVEATVSAGATGVAYTNTAGNRIVYALATSATTGFFLPRTLEPKLRFYGGRVLATPQSGIQSSAQVLGSGSAGQIQSLYRNDILGTSGTIQNVYVRLHTNSTPVASALTNYMLYMGHTAKTSYLVTDTYASNMTENAVVMSGTLTVPAGLKPGDWVKIPLSSSFAYDSTKNLSILFTTDAGSGGNIVSAQIDANQFGDNLAGRQDNAVTSAGVPIWLDAGIVDLKLDLVK